MDIRQTAEYTRALSRMGWRVFECKMQRGGKMRVLVRRIPLLGVSVAKAQRFESLPVWKEWRALLAGERVIYSALEPGLGVGDLEEMKTNRYYPDKNVFIPSRTRVIDLGKSEAELGKEMDQGTRRWLRKDTKVEIVEVGEDELDSWWREWRAWKKGYFPGLKELKIYKEEFGERAVWMGTRLGERWVGGIVMYMTKDTAVYYLAWSSREGKRAGAQYKLTWECMKRAQKMGCKKWDFEGVNDPRWPRKSWRGFSEFKRRWGGVEVEMPGCWSRWF